MALEKNLPSDFWVSKAMTGVLLQPLSLWLALTLTSCVTLDKSLGTLRAQFPYLKMRGLEVITPEHTQRSHSGSL